MQQSYSTHRNNDLLFTPYLMDRCHYYQSVTPFKSKVHSVYCSGGHFNPVVSLSAYLCGGMELPLLVPYVLAQMLGGMVGAGLTKVRKIYGSPNMPGKEKKKDEKLVRIKQEKMTHGHKCVNAKL